GDRRLVGYYTGAEALDPAALREALLGRLPEYMVPSAFVHVGAWPLTPNGKLERRALPDPEREAFGSVGYEAPRGETEETLAAIWAELLKQPKVGRHDNFFELGGHSLLAIGVIERMRQIGLHADVRTLFNAPTPAGLAASTRRESTALAVPANRIHAGTTAITPAMLPLVVLTQAEIDGLVAATPGGAANIQDIYPLAPLQEGVLFHHLMASEGDPYLLNASLRFDSRERLDRFLDALQHVVARHDILRTAIHWDGLSESVQVVLREARVRIDEVELDGEPAGRAAQLRERFDPRRTRLDLSEAPLLRIAVAHEANERWLMHVLFHHLAMDHTALETVRGEIEAVISGREAHLPAAVPFRNYVAQARLGVSRAEHESFFRAMLGEVDEPSLPFGLHDVRGDGLGIEEAVLPVDAALSQQLRAQARQLGVSAASLFHLAWARVIGAASGRDDVVFGTVLFGRLQAGAGTSRALGMFINTLPMRVDLGLNVRDGVTAVHRMLTDLLRHEHASLALAQQCSGVPAPLFSALLNYRYAVAAANAHGHDDLGGIDPLDGEERTNYPLALSVDDLGDGFRLTVQVVATQSAERIGVHLHEALAQLAMALESTPDRGVRDLPVLSEAQRREVLMEWNRTEVAHAPTVALHALFERQAERIPGATALLHGDATLSYAALNRRANRLAHRLIAQGVGPDTRVVLGAERGIDMVVGILAILKAGAAYVPVDPSWPDERLRYLVADSAPHAVLLQPGLLARFDSALGAARPPVCLLDDTAGSDLAPAAADTNPSVAVAASNLAYLIYTSGSTGHPKGVMIEHRGICNQILTLIDRYALTERDRLLQFASVTFDMSVEEIFGALSSGASLVLRTDEWTADAQRFYQLCASAGISVANLPSMFWQQLALDGDTPIPASLRQVMIGGDAASPRAMAAWFDRDGHRPRLVNAYGPTEASVNAAIEQPDSAALAGSIGRPLANTRIYLLDARGEPVPVGVEGELHIAGAGLARGYANRAALTAAQFVPDPFGPPGSRMYRSGDLARYRPDGRIEYAGRNDNQIKLRGFRIEPGEIESRMRAYAGIGEAVVMVRDEVDGGMLVGYHTGRIDSVEALRAHLSAALPAYMVPQAFVALDALPATANGKLDRRALPAPQRADTSAHGDAPMSADEQSLAQIWAGVLKLDRIGRDEDFFASGGHSLLATQMISRVRRVFGIDVPLRTVFDAPTLSAFARQLASAASQTQAPVPPLIAAARPASLPLSSEQQRLWFLDRMLPDSTLYHVPVTLRVTGALDVAALTGALEAIVARHEVLRTSFVIEQGMPTQRIAAVQALDMPLIELGSLPAAEREEEALHRIREAARLPFDLASGPLLRGMIVRLAPDHYVIALTLHHIAFDGWSTSVLMREVGELYDALTHARPARLDPLPVQYADFALWQRGWLDGEVLEHKMGYWRRQLAGAPARLHLPTDRPRPAVQSLRGATCSFTVPAPVVDGLRGIGREAQTTLFTTLYAAFQVLLWRYSGDTDICVGTPVANRNSLETEALIGFFVNTLVLRTPLDPSEAFEALVRRARDTTLSAYAHQDIPFEHLVEVLNPHRDVSHSPLFQVMLVLQNAPVADLVLGELDIAPYALDSVSAKYDLTLNIDEDGAALACTFEYCADLFDRDTIARMAAHFGQLLGSIVEDASRAVGDLPLVDAPARAAALRDALGSRVALDHDTLPALFAAALARRPDAIAVEAGDTALSYAELDARSNRLAHALRALGVGPDVPVALCAERSANMVVGLLGILKAGGAYLPLDPDYPPERLAFMLDDARPRALVGDTAHIEALAARLAAAPPTLSLADDGLHAWPSDAPELALHGDHLAYLVYTSGSTGQPKGVAVTHRNVARLVHRNDYFDVTRAPRVLQLASLNFDAATFEIWAPLLNGGTLVVAAPERHSLERLAATLVERRIDMLWLTSTLFDQMVERHLPAFASVRHVLSGGEALSVPHVRRFLEAGHGARLTNGYGPTESTTFACCHAIEAVPPDAQSVPIGRPIANTLAYVLDARGEPAPVGIAGELHLGGDGLARAYLNRPDLSAERFVPNPFVADGSRLYRTGDLVRRQADGTLVYLGRIDNQVKIRGFRIETEEIEAVLLSMPWVAEAAVTVVEATDGDRRLAAYVVRKPEASEADMDSLRSMIRQRLPEYMLPSAFVELDGLPLTANGKIDLRGLPAPDFGRGGAEYVAPGSPMEELLAEIWARVLKLERVGIHDNFFELGGHSLSATQVVSELREHVPTELPLRTFFEQPTIAAVAGVLEALIIEHIENMSEEEATRLVAQGNTAIEDEPAN
uniref:non-ribosomal peptide synthetase n=2 Tax=Burkholderia gladioli TaxID=28095 RepID=UPI00164026A6